MREVPLYSFSDAGLGWESEETKAVAASRAWDVSSVGNDEEKILEYETEESDESVRPLDSSDELEDGTDFLDLAKFPFPDSSRRRRKAVVKRGVRREARRGARIQRKMFLLLKGRLHESDEGQPSWSRVLFVHVHVGGERED